MDLGEVRMGRIRATWLKSVSKQLIEKYPDKFSTDFENNKKVLDELKLIDEKKNRNRIAGCIVKELKKRKF